MLSRTLGAALLLAAVPFLTFAQVQPNPTYLPPPPSSGTVAADSSSSVNQQWSNVLGNVLYFYDIQRSGRLPDDFRVAWRNDSVLNDGNDVGLDLSGGFFDAGNYIKATLPLCWVATEIAWGAMMFGSGYDDAHQTAYLDETLRTAFDWLLAASSNNDELVVLIGTDDVYWGGDKGIPTNRPSFIVSRKNPGTDVFASCASALAAGAMLYSGTALPITPSDNGTVASLQNTTYAQTLLNRAESLFDIAQTAKPQQVYQKATKGVDWAYGSSDYVDELIVGSTLLALATGNKSYADYAQQVYTANQYPVTDGALNWDSHAPAAPVLLAQLAIAQPSMGVKLSKYQADTEIWMDNILNGHMDQTFTTKGGLFWFRGDSDPASLNPALNAAALMFMYGGLATSKDKGNRYHTFAQSQVDYALGKNPMNTVYPVGMHPNSPQNPQSALASGGNDVDTIDTVPAVEAYVLYGGVVGGPDWNDNFSDQRSNYTETEVALDYQSPMLVIVAYQLATKASDPFYVSLTNPRVSTPPNSGSSGGLSTAAKAGIAVAVMLAVIAILAGLAYWQRERLRGFTRRQRFAKIGHNT